MNESGFENAGGESGGQRTDGKERMPRSIEEYLELLAEELQDADPALRQDALYDAEEYLRAEVANHAGQPVSEVIARIVGSYGAPAEVAAAYRQTEETVNRAMRTPRPRAHRSLPGRFFGVFADVRAYSALFYLVLAGATGIFYFTWVTAGLAMSAGMILLIIGIPFFLLFLGSTRLLSLLEGRIVETFLGVRMPRRPIYQQRDQGLFAAIGDMVTDVRTWSTLLYMLLMLPLGILYLVFALTTMSVSLSLILAPFTLLLGLGEPLHVDIHGLHFDLYDLHLGAADGLELVLVTLLGFLALTVSMHAYRGIAAIHGHIARGLLVRSSA